MSVYVDTMRAPLGRMVMSHMLADTKDELLQMADRIVLKREWIQARGTPKEPFDVSASRRAVAIEYGAVVVSGREVLDIIARKASAVS